MKTTEVAYFLTVYEGAPSIRALENLRNERKFPKSSKMFAEHRDDLLVYFSTNTSSKKVKHLKHKPHLALYYCNPTEFQRVMLGGLIEIIKDQNVKEGLWEEGWERDYPEGVNDEDYTVLNLVPKHIRSWN
jgi:general stress protein 26